MSSEGYRLRQRAQRDPRSLTGESEAFARTLSSPEYDERRHAVEALRKVAYVEPAAVIDHVSALERLASEGQSTSIRRSACHALGYVGTVDESARGALMAVRRDATDPEIAAIAHAAERTTRESSETDPEDLTAVFSRARDDPTAVFDPGDEDSTTGVSTDTRLSVADSEELDGDDVARPPERPSETTQHFCVRCGADLRDHVAPNFCPGCGTSL